MSMLGTTQQVVDRKKAPWPLKVPARPDPLAHIFDFGAKATRIGLVVGFAIAGMGHGALGVRALVSPVEMRHWAQAAQRQIHEYVWSAYDIEVVKPPAPVVPKPEEKPEEAPAPAPAPKENAAPKPAEDIPPPAAAKAGNVLTAPVDPSAPVDFTGDGFVTGNADSYVGGVTAAAGTASAPTYNPNAVAGGTPGSTGTGKAPTAAKQAVDLSKGASVLSASSWSSCPFPPEADVDQVDFASVSIVVTVREDGTPRSVQILNDPGHGFGRAARLCALSQKYAAARDKDSNPVVGVTPPFRVTFTR